MKWAYFRDLLPVFTFVLGYMGSRWSARTEAKRERARETAIAVRAFRDSTLLALQEAMMELCNAVQDYADALWESDDPKELKVGKLVDRCYKSHLKMNVLAVRIDRLELRNTALALSRRVYDVPDVANGQPKPARQELNSAFEEFNRSVAQLNDAIGDELRKPHPAP